MSANSDNPSRLVPSIDSIYLRWKNFRGFSDTGTISLKPLTLLIGPNNSGKSSVLAPLLLLKETYDSDDPIVGLKTVNKMINVGSFNDIAHNHQTDLPISFEVTFHTHKHLKKGATRPPREEAHVGRAVFEFSDAIVGHGIELSKYEVFDTEGRKMLCRAQTPTGQYNLTGLTQTIKAVEPNEVDQEFDSEVRKYIRKDYPTNFLFTDEPFGEAIRKIELKETPGALSPFAASYFSIVEGVKNNIGQILDNIRFIGPIRKQPERLYLQTGELSSYVGVQGENAPEIIFRWDSITSNYTKQFEKWLKVFDFDVSLRPKAITQDAFAIYLKERRKGTAEINLADAGFGISQVLPLIVQCVLACSHGQVLIMEQPEIHLNPKLQVSLADLFVEVANAGSAVILETHSEHMVLRLRRLIAEGKIKAQDIGLFYVEKTDGKSSIRQIAIADDGHIEGEEWPKDFFGSALEQAMGLAMAQRVQSKKDAR